MLSTSAFLALAMNCAPSIHPSTLTPIIKTESAFNPWAIGVVGRSLTKQPKSLEEAVLAVNKLVKEGANFSIGLGQINRQHFDVNNVQAVFEPCNNLRITAKLLEECYSKSVTRGANPQLALLEAISCYYSGNPKRGFTAEAAFGGTSHVQRVVANVDTADYQVPALIGDARDNEGPPQQPNTQSLQPSYESWDVLRQYPRFVPPAQPQPQPLAPKPQDLPKSIKENPDA
ncbi:lytic transglycosylase domain-containing protein (plasmid) [Pseudomonas orientalis]|uniref:lytic transglycosylase domain-containing protein n=1 Tax=Pseudomonas orientalis TaxID=76758 RepID=UPI003985966C